MLYIISLKIFIMVQCSRIYFMNLPYDFNSGFINITPYFFLEKK